MFFKLFYRDIILNKTMFLIYIAMMTGLFIIYSSSLDSTGLIVGFSCFYVTMLPVSNLIREDKFKVSQTICSLPVSRTQIISARYIQAWIIAVVCYIYILILGLIIPGSKIDISHFLDLHTFLNGMCVFGISLSLLLPFVTLVGTVGLFILLIGFQVMGVILLLVARFLSAKSVFDILFQDIPRAFHNIELKFGEFGYYIFILVFIAVITLCSYVITMLLYKRKEL